MGTGSLKGTLVSARVQSAKESAVVRCPAPHGAGRGTTKVAPLCRAPTPPPLDPPLLIVNLHDLKMEK